MTYFSIFAPSSAALRGHAQALSTIGMNIVNQTTQGFKQSDTRFVSEFNSRTDSVYPSYGGIRPKTQNLNDKQGAILSTTRELDIAISGRGFFVVNPKFDLSVETLLTRSGSM